MDLEPGGACGFADDIPEGFFVVHGLAEVVGGGRGGGGQQAVEEGGGGGGEEKVVHAGRGGGAQDVEIGCLRQEELVVDGFGHLGEEGEVVSGGEREGDIDLGSYSKVSTSNGKDREVGTCHRLRQPS